MISNEELLLLNGGKGSGNFGHCGNPGKRGGSSSRSICKSKWVRGVGQGVKEFTKLKKGKDSEFEQFLKEKKSYKGVVYRGIAVTPQETKKFKVGAVITLDTHSSSSKDKATAREFASVISDDPYSFVKNPKTHKVLFEIKQTTGKDFSDINKSQQEVILPLNSKYKITKIVKGTGNTLSKSGKFWFVHLEEVDMLTENELLLLNSVKDEMKCGEIRKSTRKGKKIMQKVCKDGSEKLIHAGDSSMKHNYSEEARKNFRARHNCDEAEPGTPKYLACKELWTKGKSVKNLFTEDELLLLNGGKGSGNHGHCGRPGHKSGPGDSIITNEDIELLLNADTSECEWRTIRGSKVCLDSKGNVVSGPENLLGKSFKSGTKKYSTEVNLKVSKDGEGNLQLIDSELSETLSLTQELADDLEKRESLKIETNEKISNDLIEKLNTDPEFRKVIVEDNNLTNMSQKELESMIREEVKDIVDSWAESSSSPQSVRLQTVVAEMFNVNKDVTDYDGVVEVVGLTEPKKEFLKAVAQSMYDDTQKVLKESGITELELYRGVLTKIPEGDYELKMNPLNSFTIDPYTAAIFSDGRTMIRQVVSAKDVFSLPKTGVGCASAYEVVTIGGSKTSNIFDFSKSRDKAIKKFKEKSVTKKSSKKSVTKKSSKKGIKK